MGAAYAVFSLTTNYGLLRKQGPEARDQGERLVPLLGLTTNYTNGHEF